MGTRAKLREKAFANAWNQFTQEKAKRLINESLKKRGRFKYHSAVKTLVMVTMTTTTTLTARLARSSWKKPSNSSFKR